MKMSSHSSLKRFKQIASAFRADTNGNFALMTALMLVPLFGFISLAVDHWKVATAKSAIENAADSAALGAVRRAEAVLKVTGNPSTAIKDGEIAGHRSFQGNVKKIADTEVQTPTIKVTLDGTTFKASVVWAANVETTFGSFYSWSNQDLSGISESSLTAGSYINIHVLVDNSGSMGIGATQDEQDQMFALTNCSIACHLVAADSTYRKVRQAGIETRIDVVRAALLEIAGKIRQMNLPENKVKIAVYAFSNVVDTIIQISDFESANMGAFRNKINEQLSLTNTGGGTDFHGALKALATYLPQNNGNGYTENSPISHVFLITDGIEHTQRRKEPNESFQTYHVDRDFLSNGEPINIVAPTPIIRKPENNQEYHGYYQTPGYEEAVHAGWTQGLNANLCTPIKARNINLTTLEIEYLIPRPIHWKKDTRFAWIQHNLLAQQGDSTVIHNRFRQCASKPELAYRASTRDEISKSINTVIASLLPKQARLLK